MVHRRAELRFHPELQLPPRGHWGCPQPRLRKGQVQVRHAQTRPLTFCGKAVSSTMCACAWQVHADTVHEHKQACAHMRA